MSRSSMSPTEENINASSNNNNNNPPTSTRGRRRSHHACLTCRRKKTRCPGEKPACSSCVRLKQSCSYPPAIRPSQSGPSEERLAHLEEKLDFLLNGSLATSQQKQNQHHQQNHHQQQQLDSALEETTDTSEKSYSGVRNTREHSYPTSHPSVKSESENSSLRPSHSDIAVGIALYFEYCHRQPIWCFERDEVRDFGSMHDELACSILALTLRFSENGDQAKLYANNAKSLIMLRIANGTVDLATLESLCLLSYSSFIDGNVHLGQFHLGLAHQLCRSAMLDVDSVYGMQDPMSDRKKRLFWSLQMLEQSYGRQEGLLSVPTEIWRPAYSTTRGSMSDHDPRAPKLPRDDLGCQHQNEPGIWNTSVHLGWVWSQVRKYVSDCAHNNIKEPWRHDSMYAKVLADFMETENRIPMCHRYDTVKFYERKVEDLKIHRDYWAPWLKEQFTYHVIPTVLNHPFLYIVGAQHNPNLAIPNTFWRRSSELALLHSTWIVRMIDMVVDKQVPLADPFFGHVAAIAATVHLYYCCAAAARLKHKSNTDFAKCRRFLKNFIPTSAACRALDRNLDKMTRIAAGTSDSMDVEDWMPSKIYLSVPLMWKILQFNTFADSHELPTAGLLNQTLVPNTTNEDANENITLEIIVASAPEITINTADGGQEAPTASYKAPLSSQGPDSARDTVYDEVPVDDNLTLCTTPWLYADSSQFVNIADMGCDDPQPALSESRGPAWWEGENFSNIMFNHF
ncbi:c6 transcription factor [Fusarium circinatum]|uniref:C6 transcription factor n=1 Tax=Fusarium circinatum TaxID=48490 RepID=A0A8H5WIF0_FUSCI|nr:c6 transcription factor [Fusarium circinatum]